ncbi:hypothetical protein LCB40_13130 [Lactobacillus corticis]|uniref:Uncharacterized protein n=1 Tax=Lactobacillus corticis TaxID=2201249 RepID=A0A916VIL6_9LACO|nr:hypothetical protein LCB40_13130 [Lactobacillus corticis]
MVQSSLIPAGTNSVASIDFAASPLAWLVYETTVNLPIIGAILLTIFALILLIWNKKQIKKGL